MGFLAYCVVCWWPHPLALVAAVALVLAAWGLKK
jgi:hypothetical protein